MAMAPLPTNNAGPGAKPTPTQYRSMLRLLNGIIEQGLKHGHFDCSISSEVTGGGKRSVVIKSGLHYKFTIGEDELP
jgi:hypothetical protein